MCALAESVLAHFHAQVWAMGTQPKSVAVEEYRRQIALYLQTVKIATGWGQVKIGDVAGVVHTTIGRALKGEHTLGFEKLMAISEASNQPIPDKLRGAAIAAQQPTRREVAEIKEQIQSVAAQLQGKTTEEQNEIIEELRRALAKAG